jgi:hypothetical protein
VIEQGESKRFHGSTGLMGPFRTGDIFAREGETVIVDATCFWPGASNYDANV